MFILGAIGSSIVACAPAASGPAVGATSGGGAEPRAGSNTPLRRAEPASDPASPASPAPGGQIDADSTASATATASGSPAATATPGQPALGSAAPELPRGTTVLHIGDSFAGALGVDLGRELRAAGLRSFLHFQTSSYIPTWAHAKELDLYLGQAQPDLILITLGANELRHPAPPERAPTIQRLVRRLGERPCVWVAPPLWEGASPALLEVIRASCAPCVFLDSSQLVPNLARARDGIHPSMQGRKVWASAVLEWLARHRAGTPERPWQLHP